MKKFFSYVTAFSILVSLVSFSPVGAAYTALDDTYISERTVENNFYHQTLLRASNSSARYTVSNTMEQTKTELLALGMPEGIINSLTADELQSYASAQSIEVSLAYYEVDSNGTISVVSEETALAAVADDNHASTRDIENPYVQDYTEDSYMRVWHAVQYNGNGSYTFGTAAVWLTMPFFRSTDSIGSAASNCTVTPGTFSGRYSYICSHSDGDGNLVEYLTNDDTLTQFTSSQFQSKSFDTFYGVGATFNLPNNVIAELSDNYVYSNFQAYIQYSGHVQTPDQRVYFNSNGTYDHAEAQISISPSLSIDNRNKIDGTIGLSLQFSTTSRTVPLEVEHIS